MNRRKRKKIGRWISYLAGLSGKGPTALDVKPGRKLTWRERIRYNVNGLVEELKPLRWNAYRQSCINVLGEGPDEDFEKMFYREEE